MGAWNKERTLNLLFKHFVDALKMEELPSAVPVGVQHNVAFVVDSWKLKNVWDSSVTTWVLGQIKVEKLSKEARWMMIITSIGSPISMQTCLRWKSILCTLRLNRLKSEFGVFWRTGIRKEVIFFFSFLRCIVFNFHVIRCFLLILFQSHLCLKIAVHSGKAIFFVIVPDVGAWLLWLCLKKLPKQTVNCE